MERQAIMVEIYYSHDESVVRETHRDDVINALNLYLL